MRRPAGQSHSHDTVAILGDSPVVCRAIAYLLEVGGYETRIFEAALDDAALSDVGLVLVAAGADLGRWRSPNLQDASPVLKLVDTQEEKEAVGEKGLLWPCTASELQLRVSSAICPASVDEPIEGEQNPREYGVPSSN